MRWSMRWSHEVVSCGGLGSHAMVWGLMVVGGCVSVYLCGAECGLMGGLMVGGLMRWSMRGLS